MFASRLQHPGSPFTSPMKLLTAASDRLTHQTASPTQDCFPAPSNPNSPQHFTRCPNHTSDAVPPQTMLQLWNQTPSTGNSPVLKRLVGPALVDKACSPLPLQAQHLPLPEILSAVRQQLLEPWAAQQLQALQHQTAPSLTGDKPSHASAEPLTVAASQTEKPVDSQPLPAQTLLSIPAAAPTVDNTLSVLSTAAAASEQVPGAETEAEPGLQLEQAAEPTSDAEAESKLQSLLEQAAVPEGLPATAAPMALSMALLEAAQQASLGMQWDEGSKLADEVADLPDSMPIQEVSDVADSRSSSARFGTLDMQSTAMLQGQLQDSSKLADDVADLPDSLVEAHPAFSSHNPSLPDVSKEILLADADSPIALAKAWQESNRLAEEVAVLPDLRAEALSATASQGICLEQAERSLQTETSPEATVRTDWPESEGLAEEVADLPDSMHGIAASSVSHSLSPDRAAELLLADAHLPASVSTARQEQNGVIDQVPDLPDSMADIAASTVAQRLDDAQPPAESLNSGGLSGSSTSAGATCPEKQQPSDHQQKTSFPLSPAADDGLVAHMLQQPAAAQKQAEPSVADSLDSLHAGDWRDEWSALQQHQQQHQQPPPAASARTHPPDSLMRRVAAASQAHVAHTPPQEAQAEATHAGLAEAMLAVAAEHRATVKQLQKSDHGQSQTADSALEASFGMPELHSSEVCDACARQSDW